MVRLHVMVKYTLRNCYKGNRKLYTLTVIGFYIIYSIVTIITYDLPTL